jgi:hypothetical protein
MHMPTKEVSRVEVSLSLLYNSSLGRVDVAQSNILGTASKPG